LTEAVVPLTEGFYPFNLPVQTMKRVFSILLCLVSLTFAMGQDSSLEQLFATEKSDAQRLELLQQMTNLAFEMNFETALAYAKRGVALSEKTGDKNWQPKFYEMQGRMHANLGQLDSASLFFDKAMSGYTANADQRGQASTKFKIAWVHNVKGELKEGLAVSLDALRIMEQLDDQKGIAGALDRVAWGLFKQEKFEESLNYAQRGIEVCRKNNFLTELPYLLQSAGYAAIGLKKHDQALAFFDEALALVRSQNMGLSTVADLENARGNALKKLGRHKEAMADYLSCLEHAQKANYAGGISTATANLGEINLLMGNYAAALPYQLKTIELQEQINDLSNLTENYGHASFIYEKLGDYESALRYERKARKMRDSTASVQSDAAMLELRTQYETEKKEATIALQDTKISQQRTVLWLSAGMAALLGLFAFSFYKNAIARKKSNELLAAKNAENELLLKEIHHRVKNNLEVVSSLLALQSAQVSDPNIKDAMLEGQNRVQSIGIVHQKLYQGDNLAAVEMKDYFINLSDNILDTFGADDRVTIECAMNQLELDIDTAVPLGLIVNEILTNALKYAFPDGRKGKIEINLEKKDDQTLRLKIADNGVGKSGTPQGTGFGSQLVSLLSRQLGGEMHEEAQDGTVVWLDFKMRKAA
jgi:two-component sensor histidine kinase